MIHIKKTILTLALLIAATTQAWAEDKLYLVIDDSGTSATLCYGDPGDYPFFDNSAWFQYGHIWGNIEIRSLISTITIEESCQNFSGKRLNSLFIFFRGLTNIYGLDNLRTDDVEDMMSMFEQCKLLTTLDLSSFNTAKVTVMVSMFEGCSNLTTLDLSSFNTSNVTNIRHMFYNCSNLTILDLSSFNTSNVTDMIEMFSGCSMLETIYVSDGWSTANVSLSGRMFEGCVKLRNYSIVPRKDVYAATTDGLYGLLTYKAPPTPSTSTPLSPSPVAVNATNAAMTEWSLTQPAGNVTLKVNYYAQAKFTNGGTPSAIANVKATTADPIVTAGTVAKIDGTDTPQGKVWYYAAQSAIGTPAKPTYTSDGWSTSVPTAAKFAEGPVYVWYYIEGAEPASGTARSDDNTFSDSDIKAISSSFVTLDAAPTYDVVINTAGLSAEEAGKWSASPNTGVKKGDDVTVTYTGTRKVIGVKAEKTGPLYMKWDDSQKALVPTEIPATVTKVEDAEHVTWPAGTYLVEGDVGINGYIELTGDVELIIKDGAKLTAKEIYGEDIYSLSVYGQTNMSGELNLACSFDDAINCMTALNIHSCKVNASSSEDNNGGFFNILEVNVYGGLVNAEYTGSSNGFGIGSDVMNIYGGEVKAIGKGNDNDYSYGINNSNGTTVNVYGGKLWAECSGNRAINSNVTLTKGEGFNGKIETCSDGTSWTVYTETGTPDAKYVRVGYSSAGAD